MNMPHSLRIAILAAVMLFAAMLPGRADTATVDDTAKFLAGMMPSAASPLTALTTDPAWQRHAKFLDGAFARGRDDLERSFGPGLRYLIVIRSFATHDDVRQQARWQPKSLLGGGR